MTDTLPPEPPRETSAPDSTAEHRFPCAQCGANLRFTPGQSRLTCQYCGHEQAIPDADAESRQHALTALDLQTALANHLPPEEIEEIRVLACPNCGAQIEVSEQTHSSECPFCATPVVTDTGTHRQIKPQALVPFRLTEPEAREAMKKWLKGLWFAPNGLAAYARKDKRLNGMYVPYWSFDAFTVSQYSGERGTHYYVSVSDGKGGTRQERRTRWRRVSGRVQRQFHDMLIMAAESLPRKYVRALEPWLLNELVPYAPSYLSGFRAEAYTVELAPGHDMAKARMQEVIRQDVRRDIGGDEQRIHSVSTQHSDEKFKHLMLPIWMAAYRYRDKSYRFVVNAQTGKVRGERPWSVWKIAFAVLLAALVVGGIVYFAEFH